MRVMLAVVLGLALLWGGYWFVGSATLERSAEAWFAGQAAQGRIATRDSLGVRGFPNRFDLTVEGVHLADLASGLGWQAPFIQIFSLTYKPWHVIAALPHEQQFQTPQQDITLTSKKLQASLIVEPGAALTLDRIAMVGEGLAARSSRGWQLAAATARLATRQAVGLPNAHEIGLDVTDLALDPALMAALAGRSTLPAQVAVTRIDAIATFSGPIDRFATTARPALLGIDLREARLRWGDLTLFGKGQVRVGPDGLASGRIDLRLENWRMALLPAVALGLITPEVAPTVERAMEALAGQSPNPDVLDLPLIFAAGRASLGPIPLGPAPRLR